MVDVVQVVVGAGKAVDARHVSGGDRRGNPALRDWGGKVIDENGRSAQADFEAHLAEPSDRSHLRSSFPVDKGGLPGTGRSFGVDARRKNP